MYQGEYMVQKPKLMVLDQTALGTFYTFTPQEIAESH